MGLKPHFHGRLLAARIDILPFFFLKSRRSLTRRKIHAWFCLRDIARHATEKSNRSSHSHGRDFNAALAFDCNSLKSLTRWDCVPVILAKSSRRKSRYRTGLLTRCEIVSKRCLLVLNLQKANCCKSTSNAPLVNHALEFWKKMNEDNASVKRNTKNTIKQLMSKLAMKMQGERWSSNGGVLLEPNVWYVNAILSWLGWSKVKRALMLIIYYKILSFTL